MKPIKLVAGLGDQETGGCWMSALSLYAGEAWSDHPNCVDPSISSLCIAANDLLTDDESRGRIIGPRLLDPIGTRDPSAAHERLMMFVAAAGKWAAWADGKSEAATKKWAAAACKWA